MKLIHFFRLIQMSIFQEGVINMMYNKCYGNSMTYDNTWFFCPRIVCNDGFSISLQIHNSNYCSSENGYRTLGHTMETVEFGFPNQEIIDKHGGIDWDKTVSIKEFNNLVYGKKDRK